MFYSILDRMKKKFIFLIFLFYPNVSHAYIDPNLFAVIWQVLAAFLFSLAAYSRFFYGQTIAYFKKIELLFLKLRYFYIIEIFVILSVILIPILYVLTKDNNIFEQEIIFVTILVQLFILLLVSIFNYFIIKNVKKTLIFSCAFFLTIQLYGFCEGLIITYFFNAENLKYFRILSLVFVLSTTYFLLINYDKKNHKKFLRVFSIFLISSFVIIFFNGLKSNEKNFSEKNIWSYKSPPITKINYSQNIYLIIADSYISPSYFSKIYDQKNILYDYLKENNFLLKLNSLSNYSSTTLSLPSIYNSNYYKAANKESLKYPYELIENSYLMKTIKESGYNHNLHKCYYNYIGKNQFCKKLTQFKKINGDLNLLETIYYYNSIYSAFRHFKKFVYLRLNKTDHLKNKSTIKVDLDNIVSSNKKKNFNTIIFSIPHAPYVVDGNCKWKDVPAKELTVNNFFIKDHDARINGYYDNIQCVNKHIMHTIKNINENDDKALIILISDNGPLLRPKKLKENNDEKLSDKDKLALDYNSSIFAIGGNFKCKKMLDNINLINTFRVILNCNSDKNDPLLPEKIYISEMNKIFEITLYHTGE